MAEGSKSKEAYQQMNKRAIDAERVRDESLIKMDSLQGEVTRLELEYVIYYMYYDKQYVLFNKAVQIKI